MQLVDYRDTLVLGFTVSTSICSSRITARARRSSCRTISRRRFIETGRFVYHRLTRDNRGLLLFNRHTQLFLLASKRPIHEVIGPSIVDPTVE